jgi:squalene-hopene/tetraprenyl-beta-curcumene cyclase
MRSGFQRRHWSALLLATMSLVACSRSGNVAPGKWNREAAAQYLDQRQVVWMAWPSAARDHGTFCISCHTGLPYVLARPALRSALAERGPSDAERKIVENVAERVRLWSEIGPYYSGEGYESAKPAESRGTESILNALILASNDAREGRLSDITRTAFNNMWALQLREGNAKGAWPWLDFDLQPWETADAQYYGAAMAALAIGIAPED